MSAFIAGVCLVGGILAVAQATSRNDGWHVLNAVILFTAAGYLIHLAGLL